MILRTLSTHDPPKEGGILMSGPAGTGTGIGAGFGFGKFPFVLFLILILLFLGDD